MKTSAQIALKFSAANAGW